MMQEITDTPFNMAMLFYTHIHQLRIFKSRTVISGDIHAYSDALMEIFIATQFKFTQDEKDKVLNDFRSVASDLSCHMRGKMGQQVMTMNLMKSKQKLREIDMNLHILMDKYKMIFPNMEIKGLSSLMKKYDLGKDNG